MKNFAVAALGIFATSVCFTSSDAVARALPTFSSTVALAGADQDAEAQRREYDEYQKIKAESDLRKKVDMAKAFLQKAPGDSKYAPYVKGEFNKALYAIFSEQKTANKYQETVAVGKEYIQSNPNTELFFTHEFALLAQKLGNEALVGKKDATPYFSDTIAHASRAISLIESGQKLDANMKDDEWGKLKPNYLAYYHYASGLANFNLKKTADAEALLIKTFEYGCTSYPNAYFILGQIQDTRYDEKAKAYSALPDDKKTADEGKKALDEAYAEAKKASEYYAKCLIVAQASPQAKDYADLIKDTKDALEFAYKVWNNDKADGMDKYVETFKDVCKK
jgi:hypothetical protein